MENDIGPVMVVKVDEAEMDEMWSFVRSKKQRRWLWSAIILLASFLIKPLNLTTDVGLL
jgi:hypothetical protein